MPQVTMPQLGEGVEEGTIGKWLKTVGDHVRVGDPLVEVVTDKVNAEVPSPFEGTLTKILAAEGLARVAERNLKSLLDLADDPEVEFGQTELSLPESRAGDAADRW